LDTCIDHTKDTNGLELIVPAQEDILSRARAIDKVNKGTNRDFCPKRSSSIVYYVTTTFQDMDGHLSIAIAGYTPCSVSLGSDYRDAGNGPTAFGTLDAGFFVSFESSVICHVISPQLNRLSPSLSTASSSSEEPVRSVAVPHFTSYEEDIVGSRSSTSIRSPMVGMGILNRQEDRI